MSWLLSNIKPFCGKGWQCLAVSVLVMALLLCGSKLASVGLSTPPGTSGLTHTDPSHAQPDCTCITRAADRYGTSLWRLMPVSGTLLLVSARAAECSDYSERVSHEFPFKQTILSNWETHHIQHVYPQHTPTHLDLIVREHFKTLMPQAEGWGVWQFSLTWQMWCSQSDPQIQGILEIFLG